MSALLAERYPGIEQWSQSSGMDEEQRQGFLDRFVENGHGIGFAVLGGAFAEGVDLPGTRLIGAFIEAALYRQNHQVWRSPHSLVHRQVLNISPTLGRPVA